MSDRWDTIQRLRSRVRDQAAGEVEQVNIAIRITDEKINEIQNERHLSVQSREKGMVGQIDVNELMAAERYELVLIAQITNVQQQREMLVSELANRKAKLVKAQQDLEAIEKLQKKLAEREYQTSLQRQQSELDQWSNTRAVTNRRSPVSIHERSEIDDEGFQR